MQTEVSEATLEATPERVLAFLRTAGTNAEIGKALVAAGFTEADHAEGFALFRKVARHLPPAPPPTDDAAAATRDAIAAVEGWAAQAFPRIHAALEHLHPDAFAFVFAGELAPGSGMEAVVATGVLLDRLGRLGGPPRKAHKKEDKAALATLAKRGLGSEAFAEVRKLVDAAEKANLSFDAPTPPPANDAYERDLKALRAWYVDWATTAKAVVMSRKGRIALGLAKRRKPAKAPTPGGEPAKNGGATSPTS